VGHNREGGYDFVKKVDEPSFKVKTPFEQHEPAQIASIKKPLHFLIVFDKFV
jgi:hypothetical protein